MHTQTLFGVRRGVVSVVLCLVVAPTTAGAEPCRPTVVLRGQHAAAAFERAARTPNGSVGEDAEFWRAVALVRAGQRGPATLALRRFLASHPGSSRRGEASAILGKLLLEAGDRVGARTSFEVARADRNPDLRRAAVRALESMDRTHSDPRQK